MTQQHNRPALGLDLGTTNSLIATANQGKVRLLLGPEGQLLLPSVVHYAADGAVLVGHGAAAFAEREPARTLASVKRWMGRSANEPGASRELGTRFAIPQSEDEARTLRFELGDRRVTPLEVSSELVKALAQSAREQLGELGTVVVTVPAYFDDAQRQATRDAGRLAGLESVRLLNEPTAAALAYGLAARQNGTFLVYDLGGGTFDVTILRLEDGLFQVKSTGGDTALGGDDVDRLLALGWLESQGLEPGDVDYGELRQLLAVARELKHQLTLADTASANVTLAGGLVRPFTLTRTELNALLLPLLERTGRAVRRALRDASLSREQLNGVVLVGGATRMPALRDYVTELLGQAPLDGVDPDTVVAAGAALQAELLASGSEDVLLLDVLPLSLGIETMGGLVERLLPRNCAVPAGAMGVFTTHVDNQTGFSLKIVQGERELAADCRSLAEFTLRGLPALPAGRARLELSFAVDENGLLTVTARELVTGLIQVVEVRPSAGLSSGEVEALVAQAAARRSADVEARALAELRVHGEGLVRATDRSLSQDGDLLGDDERSEIDEALERLRRGLGNAERALLLELLVEELHVLTREFAERRMNRAVVEAVTGAGLRSAQSGEGAPDV